MMVIIKDPNAIVPKWYLKYYVYIVANKIYVNCIYFTVLERELQTG